MKHVCPACHWPHLQEAPRSRSSGASYEICPSCGFQSGVTDDDEGHTAAAWRTAWKKRGMPWSSVAHSSPADWDPAAQVKKRTR